MGFAFDAIVILILVCSVYRGYKKGILDVGFKLLALIVSILVALILYNPITELIINNTEIDETIADAIVRNKDEKNENSVENRDEYINNLSKEVKKNIKNSMIESAAKPIAKNIISSGVIIMLFIGSRIILMVLKMFTDIVTKIPVIKQLNQVAGVVYGAIIGLLIIYIALAIVYFIVSIDDNNVISGAVERSYITKILFERFFG